MINFEAVGSGALRLIYTDGTSTGCRAAVVVSTAVEGCSCLAVGYVPSVYNDPRYKLSHEAVPYL